HQGSGWNQLRMREALVDVFIDDVRLVQHQIAFDQNRHLAIRIHGGDIFRFIEEVDVTDFEIHAFFKQNKAATLGKRASRARIENHHFYSSLETNRVRRGTTHPLINLLLLLSAFITYREVQKQIEYLLFLFCA